MKIKMDELLEFWEVHDFTDYMAEMEEVPIDSLKPKPSRLHLETPLPGINHVS